MQNIKSSHILSLKHWLLFSFYAFLSLFLCQVALSKDFDEHASHQNYWIYNKSFLKSSYRVSFVELTALGFSTPKENTEAFREASAILKWCQPKEIKIQVNANAGYVSFRFGDKWGDYMVKRDSRGLYVGKDQEGYEFTVAINTQGGGSNVFFTNPDGVGLIFILKQQLTSLKQADSKNHVYPFYQNEGRIMYFRTTAYPQIVV